MLIGRALLPCRVSAGSDNQVVESAKFCEHLSILVPFSSAMSAHDEVCVRVVRAYLGVQVSNQDPHVSLWCSVHSCLDLLIKLLFVFNVRCVGRGVTINTV